MPKAIQSMHQSDSCPLQVQHLTANLVVAAVWAATTHLCGQEGGGHTRSFCIMQRAGKSSSVG